MDERREEIGKNKKGYKLWDTGKKRVFPIAHRL